MEATGFNGDEIEKLVECHICLERLNNPRVLACTHTFCKECLDDIMKFESDGSGVINCPLRCTQVTRIGRFATTNNLKASVKFKQIIDFLSEKLDRKDGNEVAKLHCGNENCGNTTSHYCLVCCMKLCELCKSLHMHHKQNMLGTDEYIRVKYRTREGYDNIFPWCEEHKTWAKYACQRSFVCLYCTKRAHANHQPNKVELVAQQIITWVQSKKIQSPELEALLLATRTKTENEVKVIRGMLCAEINKRKYLSIRKHLTKLNDEEERLLHKFDSIIANHFAAYPSSKQPADYIKDKLNFEIVASKVDIVTSIKNVTSRDVIMPHEIMTFNEEAINESTPLGILLGLQDKTQLPKDDTSIIQTVTSWITEAEVSNEHLEALLNELKQLQAELEIKYLTTPTLDVDVNTNDDFRLTDEQDVLDTFQTIENDKSKIEFLITLMKENNLSKFKLLIYFQPQVLLNLNSNGVNLLHYSAILNKPAFANVILDAGGDINGKGKCGTTALHLATTKGNLSFVKLLVERDANILIKGSNGKMNAIDAAKKLNYPEIVTFLSEQLQMKGLKDDGLYCNTTLGELTGSN